jgi:hypothetical protein
MIVEEVLEGFVSASCHSGEFGALERIHGNAADEGNVYAEATVNAGTGEAHEDAQFGRCLRANQLVYIADVEIRERRIAYPLRAGRTAVDAFIVVIGLLDLQQLRDASISTHALQT